MVDNGKESPLQVGLILWATLWSMLKKLTALKESENRFNQITLSTECTHALHSSFFFWGSEGTFVLYYKFVFC